MQLIRSNADFPHAGAVTLIQSVKLWGTPRGRESASAYRLAAQPLPPALSLPAMLSPAPAPGRGGALPYVGRFHVHRTPESRHHRAALWGVIARW